MYAYNLNYFSSTLLELSLISREISLTHTHIHTYTGMHKHTHTYTGMHTHTHTHINTQTHINTHTHTHTHTKPLTAEF